MNIKSSFCLVLLLIVWLIGLMLLLLCIDLNIAQVVSIFVIFCDGMQKIEKFELFQSSLLSYVSIESC